MMQVTALSKSLAYVTTHDATGDSPLDNMGGGYTVNQNTKVSRLYRTDVWI